MNTRGLLLTIVLIALISHLQGSSFTLSLGQNSTRDVAATIKLIENLERLKDNLKIPEMVGVDVDVYISKIEYLKKSIVSENLSIDQALKEYESLSKEIQFVKIEAIKRLLLYVLIAEVFMITLLSIVVSKV